MINIGIFERFVRVIGGMLIFSLYFILKRPISYLALIGLLPVITGSIGACPMYAFLGINSNRARER
ncbi:MAG: DUF2892 domain-containing protein [Ignavibacteriales bacterium]